MFSMPDKYRGERLPPPLLAQIVNERAQCRRRVPSLRSVNFHRCRPSRSRACGAARRSIQPRPLAPDPETHAMARRFVGPVDEGGSAEALDFAIAAREP